MNVLLKCNTIRHRLLLEKDFDDIRKMLREYVSSKSYTIEKSFRQRIRQCKQTSPLIHFHWTMKLQRIPASRHAYQALPGFLLSQSFRAA